MGERSKVAVVGEWIRTVGAAIAILGSFGVGFSYAFDALPVPKLSEFRALKTEVAQIKSSMAEVVIGQKENTELSLMLRIDSIADRLQRLAPDSRDYVEMRAERVVAQQRLRQVRDDLTAVKVAPK